MHNYVPVTLMMTGILGGIFLNRRDFSELKGDMHRQFGEVAKRLDRVDARLDRMDTKLDGLTRICGILRSWKAASRSYPAGR